MKTVGATVGYEARVYNARGVSDTGRGIGIITRGPNVDLVHDPRWGRTEESFGEDPYLVGEMAKGYLAGLHGDDPRSLLAACTLKHFAANSNETTRISSSSNLDARNLREYYTATFRTAVREGHADGIMTAYNQINGVPAGVSPILKAMVRGEWGFDGFFSTDGQAATHWVQDQPYFPTLDEAVGAAIAEASGVLLQSNVAPNVNAAFAMGLITAADVDAAIGPALRIRFRTGDFDPPASVPYKAIQSTETPWATDEAKARALDVTRRTIVLLKNANAHAPPRPHARSARGDRPARRLGRARLVRRHAPYPYVTGRQGIVDKLAGTNVHVTYVLNDNGGAATSAAAALRRRDRVRRQPPDLRRALPAVGNLPVAVRGARTGRPPVHRPGTVAAGAGPVGRRRQPAHDRRPGLQLSAGDRLDQRQRPGDRARDQLGAGAGPRRRGRPLRRLQPRRTHDHDLVPERGRHPDGDHRLRHQEGDDVLVLHRRAALSVRPRPVIRDVRVCEPER